MKTAYECVRVFCESKELLILTEMLFIQILLQQYLQFALLLYTSNFYNLKNHNTHT
jgi:hypothetical protein